LPVSEGDTAAYRFAVWKKACTVWIFRRQFSRALAVFLVAVACLSAPFLLQDDQRRIAVSIALATVGFLGTIFSTAGMLIGDQVERFDRFTKVDGAVVRWGGDCTVHKASLGGDDPCCLCLYVGMRGTGAPVFTNVVVPVPGEAIPAATRVRDDFLAGIELAG
jgi:hypothetical protein